MLALLQQNLSMEDTIGTQLAVLYREVSLIQICTQLYVIGSVDSVLIREESLFRLSFIERFHCS